MELFTDTQSNKFQKDNLTFLCALFMIPCGCEHGSRPLQTYQMYIDQMDSDTSQTYHAKKHLSHILQPQNGRECSCKE